MNIDITQLSQPVTDYEGESLGISYFKVILNVLGSGRESEKDITGEEKLRRHNLAVKIVTAKQEGKVDISIEEAAKILDLVNKDYATVVYGKLNDILNNSK